MEFIYYQYWQRYFRIIKRWNYRNKIKNRSIKKYWEKRSIKHQCKQKYRKIFKIWNSQAISAGPVINKFSRGGIYKPILQTEISYLHPFNNNEIWSWLYISKIIKQLYPYWWRFSKVPKETILLHWITKIAPRLWFFLSKKRKYWDSVIHHSVKK